MGLHYPISPQELAVGGKHDKHGGIFSAESRKRRGNFSAAQSSRALLAKFLAVPLLVDPKVSHRTHVLVLRTEGQLKRWSASFERLRERSR